MSSARVDRFFSCFLKVLYTLAIVTGAFFLREGLNRLCGISLPPFVTLYLAVMVVAMLFGFGMGIWATACAAFLVGVWVMPPVGSLAIASLGNVITLPFFAGMGVLISAVAGQARSRQRRIAELESERALKNSELRYRTVFQTSLDPIAITRLDNEQFADANYAFLQICGYAREELLGQSSKQLGMWTEPDARQMVFDEARAGHEIHDLRFRFRHKNGRQGWATVSASKIELDGAPCLLSIVRDITEKLETEEALHSTEARLQLFIEHAPAAMAMFDRDMRYIAVSERWLEDYGLLGQKLLGKSHYGIFPEIGEAWKQFHRRGMAGETILCNEDRFVRANGSLQRLRWELRPWTQPDGAVGGIVIFSEDITEKRRAAEALKASEARYRSAFENSYEAVSIVRLDDGQWVDVNPSFVEMFGYSREELVGHTMLELGIWKIPDMDSVRERMIAELRATGSVHDRELPFRKKDGGCGWCVFSASAIEVDGIPCALFVIHDMTQARRAADALKTSELRFRTAFETSQDGIAIFALSNQNFVDVNPAFVRITGWSREELVGHNSLDLNLFVHLSERKMLLDTLARDGAFREIPVEMRRKDGEIFWGVFSTALMEIDGVRYALVTSKDITGARRAQEALRTSEERYRTAFLTSIDPIAITNFNDGTYVDVNQRLTNMLGYSREEMIGHTSLELEIWTDPQKREAIFAPLRQGEEVKEKLCRFRRKNGESFPALVSSALVTIGGAPAIHSVIRDITETTKAEQERLASEARYRAAFHTSLDAVVLMDFKTRKLLEANERFLSVMGYSQEDVVNMTPGELRMWEDDNERIRLAKELSRQGSIEEKLTRLQHKNGEAFWATISASTFVLGGRRCVLTVIRDVTEKLKAENALRESEARYRTAFQTSLDAVAINRMDNQQYVDVNNAYERLFGYTREEMLSHTSAEVNLWTDPELRARFYRMLRRDAAVHDLVFGFRRKGGQPGWGTLSASVIDLDGVQCTLVVIHDITARRKAEEVSRASENRYRAVFETSKDAISILRVGDEKLLDVNRAWCNLYGYAREEVVDKDTRGLQLWIDGEARLRTYEKIHRGEEIRDVEFRFLRKNGEQGWATATTSNIELDGTQCVMFAAHDVTEERRAKIVMRESEARYRTVFQTSHDALIITRNRDGAYVDVSQAFLNLTGWSRKEAIGNTSIGLNLWVDLDRRAQLLLYLERGERVDNFEVRFRNKSGGIFVGLLALAPMEVAGEECCLTTIHDITAVRYAEQQIHSLSYYDPLTGLANRRMLRLKLEEEARRSAGDGRHLAILCINLDNFESIANAFGRSVGDIVLRQAGVRIGKCVTRSDLITHQEGAEFFVLLPQLDSSLDAAAGRAHTVAENIAAQIGIPAMVEGHECICSCSVGMALCTGQSAVEGDAMQRAHIAMQQSRTAGRNGICCYSSGLQEALSARAALEEDLRQGIRENQFVLYYQPQIGSGKLIGAEALLRWNHPRLGLLGPDRFIELAEESRLILPLGKWVLAEACRQITAWKQHHVLSEMKISVNISALQFYEPGFVESVFRALESANADPARLAVELTESVLLYNIEDVIAKMQTLRERGIGFSLDDFGTGYSSLSYLKRLPLSQLKIDRSFVRDIFTDSSSKAIAQAVISLSTALNVPVIAEGVETDEQRAALVRMGCTNFQGYLFGRPVASDDFESSLPQLLESALHAARKS